MIRSSFLMIAIVIYQVDLELGDSIDFVIFCTLTIVVSLLSIIVVTPWFGVAVIPLGYICKYRRFNLLLLLCEIENDMFENWKMNLFCVVCSKIFAICR